MNVRFAVRGGLAVVCGALLLSAAACGNDEEGKHTSPKPAARSASANAATPAGSLAGKPADEILTAATTAAKSLKSVHVEGSMVDKDGVTVLNLTLGPDSARGTLTVPYANKPVSMELIRLRERVFVRSQDLWRVTHGGKAAKLLGHRWVLLPKIDDRLRKLSLNGMLNPSDPSDPSKPDDGPVTRVGIKTVNGRSAIALKFDTGQIIYIAAEGKPVPLRLGEPGGRDWYNFTDHDAPLDIREPADFVDLKKPPPGV